jgi:hypothetical protein
MVCFVVKLARLALRERKKKEDKKVCVWDRLTPPFYSIGNNFDRVSPVAAIGKSNLGNETYPKQLSDNLRFFYPVFSEKRFTRENASHLGCGHFLTARSAEPVYAPGTSMT